MYRTVVVIFLLIFVPRIDDIEDGSELRRAQPVAHAIFGVPQTINAANYVYFIALERALALNHPKVKVLCNYVPFRKYIFEFLQLTLQNI